MILEASQWLEAFSLHDLIGAAKIIVVVVLLFFLRKFFTFPLDWTKDIDESGYQYVKKAGFKRLDKINTIRRTRKIGNIPPVFPNGWFVLAESHQVGGSPIHVNALGENFVIFRGASGKCHVLDAFCPHLGANMAIGGRVVGDCIECPFHRWQFKGDDGKCSSIPYADKVPSFAQVRHWKSVEINDLIFVWYHAEGEEPTWAPEEIPEIQNKIFTYCGRNEFHVNAHIQEIPENGSDLWHFNSIHGKSFIYGSDIRRGPLTWPNLLTHNWTSQWEPSTLPNKNHLAHSKLEHYISFCGLKFCKFNVEISQMGAGYVEMKFSTPMGIVIMTQFVTPMEPLVQRIVHRVYTRPYLVLYGIFIIIGESLMVERDIMVWNNKKYLEKPMLVKEDHLLAKYRRWFAQFFSPNSPTYSQVKSSLEW